MNIDYIIMGHVSRERYWAELQEQLGRSVKLCVDPGGLGVWENAKSAWQWVDPQSDYGVVIQDDAILCDNFTVKAEQFLMQHTGKIVSFYFGDDPTTAKYIRPDYFDAMLYHAVALAIPTKHIPAMLKYCDTRHEVQGDDMKIRRWLIAKNKTCRYSNPSLVQHRDIPSVVKPEKPVRRSAIYEQ